MSRSLAALALTACLSATPALGAEPTAVMPPAPQAPVADTTTSRASAPPAGQWVYTTQYGWVWMPYAQSYTYVNATADQAYMYVYYPDYGWSWVLSPWVIGVGPAPYWGVYGRAHFVWYAHPWFYPGGHGHFYHAPVYAHGFHGGGYAHGYHGGGYHGGHGHG